VILISVNFSVTLCSYFNILFNDFGVAERIMVVKSFASLLMLARYVVSFTIYFCNEYCCCEKLCYWSRCFKILNFGPWELFYQISYSNAAFECHTKLNFVGYKRIGWFGTESQSQWGLPIGG